jgi:hypothetical protein
MSSAVIVMTGGGFVAFNVQIGKKNLFGDDGYFTLWPHPPPRTVAGLAG